MKARLQARRYVYRGDDGWIIIGKDTLGRKVSIFVETSEAVEACKARIRAGENVRVEDMTR